MIRFLGPGLVAVVGAAIVIGAVVANDPAPPLTATAPAPFPTLSLAQAEYVKTALCGSSVDIGQPRDVQGCGRVDACALLNYAGHACPVPTFPTTILGGIDEDPIP